MYVVTRKNRDKTCFVVTDSGMQIINKLNYDIFNEKVSKEC